MSPTCEKTMLMLKKAAESSYNSTCLQTMKKENKKLEHLRRFGVSS